MSMTFNGNIQLIGKQPLSVTENGTYNAPSGKAYDPVTVNVSGGGGQVEEQLKGLIERTATHIDIPNGTTKIGNDAFSNFTSLASITIPNSVTSIENVAFNNCTSLTSITIPGSVTSIGRGAFSNCTSLTSITIPNSVTSIGSYAFSSSTSLTSITIPNSVTSIGYGAFYNCTALTTITCDFAQGAVSGAPWGAPNTTQIIYLR